MFLFLLEDYIKTKPTSCVQFCSAQVQTLCGTKGLQPSLWLPGGANVVEFPTHGPHDLVLKNIDELVQATKHLVVNVFRATVATAALSLCVGSFVQVVVSKRREHFVFQKGLRNCRARSCIPTTQPSQKRNVPWRTTLRDPPLPLPASAPVWRHREA